MKKTIICINCKNPFTITRKRRVDSAKFCSNKCKNQYSKVQLECFTCGKIFERHKGIIRARGSKKYFCSFECRFEYNKKFGTWNKGLNLIEVTCDWCGNKIIKPFSILNQYNNHFCCKECYNKWMSKNQIGEKNPSWKSKKIHCDFCDKTYFISPSVKNKGNHHFCSRKCKGNWMSENLSRENNPNWLGGFVDYRGKNWKTQKEKALQRDDYICQRCGNTKNLVVHHIISFRYFGTEDYFLANQLENLVTYCCSCHGKIEAENRRLLKEVML